MNTDTLRIDDGPISVDLLRARETGLAGLTFPNYMTWYVTVFGADEIPDWVDDVYNVSTPRAVITEQCWNDVHHASTVRTIRTVHPDENIDAGAVITADGYRVTGDGGAS